MASDKLQRFKVLLGVFLGCSLSILLGGCTWSGDVSKTIVQYENPQLYTREEIEDAMDVVYDIFTSEYQYKDCIMTCVRYDEELSQNWSGTLSRKAIALVTTFDIGDHPARERIGNKKAECLWVLQLDEDTGKWQLYSRGEEG